MLRAMIKLAWQQAVRFRLQSILAMLGVAIGVANIILLVSITDLGKRQSTGLINELGANLVFITPFIDMESGPVGLMSTSQMSSHLPARTMETVRATSVIESVAGALLLPGHVSRAGEEFFTTVQGASPEFMTMRGYEVETGRWISAGDERSRARVVCLGDTVLRALFGEDSQPLEETLEIRGEEFEVVGLMEFKGKVGFEDIDNRVFIPLSTAQEVFEFDAVHGIAARYAKGVKPEAAVAAVKEQLAKELEPGQELDEEYSVFTIKEARELMGKTLGIFEIVLASIASIALVVAGLGIMNVMLIRVMQRRLEIGIRRASGARQGDIVRQFIIEGALQALIGATAGAVLGVVGVWLYTRYAEWGFYVNGLTIVGAVLFGLLSGIAFSAYPALRAARLDPIEALRTGG
jgi:putative ABC transport system permease protein